MEIHKKIRPEYFQMIVDGKKEFELRVADFEVKEGDILILEEQDPKTKKFTGRIAKKKIKHIMKINPTEMYDLNDIKKHGFYIMRV